jgi:acid stress-induced BolA-like protein IbaG/YrbA
MTSQIIKQLIESGLPGADIKVESEDGIHFRAFIVSELFSDKNMLQQHRMVHEILGDKIGKDIHALSLKTLTPKEYKKIINVKNFL